MKTVPAPQSQDALAIALKMALAVPLADIMAYRKVGRAFFQLLEVLSHNHAPVLAATDTATFAFLVRALSPLRPEPVRCTNRRLDG